MNNASKYTLIRSSGGKEPDYIDIHLRALMRTHSRYFDTKSKRDLFKLIYHGVKAVELLYFKEKGSSRELFEIYAMLKEFMSLLTPNELMLIFPVDKDYDGEKDGLLDAIEQGYKTALFSGELKRKRVYKWLTYQAAGKKYIHSTQYENFYEMNKDCEEPISKWLNEKVYIYNNNYGNLFSFIKSELNKLVCEKKVDLIILDNLMSIDIDDLSDETNKQQTVFVNQLKRFAESNNVHVVFVAHPKKPQEHRLIGKYDVSGSANMPNYVDNIMIIYRVTESYKKQKIKDFQLSVDEKAGNEIRICKDRTGGEMDLFIPLYFEKESRRLKNTPEEVKFYGWRKPYSPYEDSNVNMVEITDADELPVM